MLSNRVSYHKQQKDARSARCGHCLWRRLRFQVCQHQHRLQAAHQGASSPCRVNFVSVARRASGALARLAITPRATSVRLVRLVVASRRTVLATEIAPLGVTEIAFQQILSVQGAAKRGDMAVLVCSRLRAQVRALQAAFSPLVQLRAPACCNNVLVCVVRVNLVQPVLPTAPGAQRENTVHLHRIACVGCVWRDATQTSCWVPRTASIAQQASSSAPAPEHFVIFVLVANFLRDALLHV